MQFEMEIHPVGWLKPTRFDIIGISGDNKRYYMGYACCMGHAKLVTQLVARAAIDRSYTIYAAKLFEFMRKGMNEWTIRQADSDKLINQALCSQD